MVDEEDPHLFIDHPCPVLVGVTGIGRSSDIHVASSEEGDSAESRNVLLLHPTKIAAALARHKGKPSRGNMSGNRQEHINVREEKR